MSASTLIGITRALAEALSTRLPDLAVVSSSPAGTPALRLQVDVEAFEARTDGSCVLTVRWAVADGARRDAPTAAERVTLAEPAAASGGPTDDAAVAAAMTRAIAALAERIAEGVRRRAPSVSPGRR